MNKKVSIALIIPVLAFTVSSCGDTVYVVNDTVPEEESSDTSKPEKAETTTTVKTKTSRPPASTKAPSPSLSYDPDGYDSFIWEEANEFWWLYTTDDLLTMGLLVCDELDRGSSLDSVTEQIVNAMINTNTSYLMEGMAAMTVAAINFLCPEHSSKLSTL